jgi:hypothetical protein
MPFPFLLLAYKPRIGKDNAYRLRVFTPSMHVTHRTRQENASGGSHGC